MKYVLQIHKGLQVGYYVNNDQFITSRLSAAMQFNTFSNAETFARKFYQLTEPDVMPVTDKELFRAKLADS